MPIVPIQPLAWELPYAEGAALKKKEKKKKKKDTVHIVEADKTLFINYTSIIIIIIIKRHSPDGLVKC